MEITGVSEPEARIKQVRRSLSRVGTEWHRITRSKSPARKRWAASFTEETDSTRYPAERKAMFRFLSNGASRPTERTRMSGIRSPNSGCVKLARRAVPLGDNGGLDGLERWSAEHGSFVGGSEGDYCCDLVLRADCTGFGTAGTRMLRVCTFLPLRFILQDLPGLGALRNCLSEKSNCSPRLKPRSSVQYAQGIILSTSSI